MALFIRRNERLLNAFRLSVPVLEHTLAKVVEHLAAEYARCTSLLRCAASGCIYAEPIFDFPRILNRNRAFY